MLVGTWADATWAINFYQRNSFDLMTSQPRKVELLKTYWTIPDRQIESSVSIQLLLESVTLNLCHDVDPIDH